jgi:hypothetical protein
MIAEGADKSGGVRGVLLVGAIGRERGREVARPTNGDVCVMQLIKLGLHTCGRTKDGESEDSGKEAAK